MPQSYALAGLTVFMPAFYGLLFQYSAKESDVKYVKSPFFEGLKLKINSYYL